MLWKNEDIIYQLPHRRRGLNDELLAVCRFQLIVKYKLARNYDRFSDIMTTARRICVKSDVYFVAYVILRCNERKSQWLPKIRNIVGDYASTHHVCPYHRDYCVVYGDEKSNVTPFALQLYIISYDTSGLVHKIRVRELKHIRRNPFKCGRRICCS